MIDKLLPCPFCGGEPLLGNPGLSRLRRISCKNCDASPSSSFSPEDAAAKWNNRVGGAPRPKISIVQTDVMLSTLRAIADFPITDPKNLDAMNMQILARSILPDQSFDEPACRSSSQASQHHSGDLEPGSSEAKETLVGELTRLVEEWRTAEGSEREEAWNLIADFTCCNWQAIASALTILRSAASTDDAHTILREKYVRANARADQTRGENGWVSGYNLGYAAAIGDIIDVLSVNLNAAPTTHEATVQIELKVEEGGAGSGV